MILTDVCPQSALSKVTLGVAPLKRADKGGQGGTDRATLLPNGIDCKEAQIVVGYINAELE